MARLGCTEWDAATGSPHPPAFERRRIMRFHFESDRRRAIIAKMAALATIQAITGATIEEIQFTRSAYGKPTLHKPIEARQQIQFNLSHHGDWVVMVAEARIKRPPTVTPPTPNGEPHSISLASFTVSRDSELIPLPYLGCDVTTWKLPPGATSVEEYFDCMVDCFTPAEWILIRSTSDDTRECERAKHDKVSPGPTDASGPASYCPSCALVRFGWFWSLKESIIKAIGTGLSTPLQVRSNTTQHQHHDMYVCVCRTASLIPGQLIFAISFLVD